MHSKSSSNAPAESVGFRVVVDLSDGWRLKIGPLLTSDQACTLVLHVRELLKLPGLPPCLLDRRPMVVSETLQNIEDEAA